MAWHGKEAEMTQDSRNEYRIRGGMLQWLDAMIFQSKEEKGLNLNMCIIIL